MVELKAVCYGVSMVMRCAVVAESTFGQKKEQLVSQASMNNDTVNSANE